MESRPSTQVDFNNQVEIKGNTIQRKGLNDEESEIADYFIEYIKKDAKKFNSLKACLWKVKEAKKRLERCESDLAKATYNAFVNQDRIENKNEEKEEWNELKC